LLALGGACLGQIPDFVGKQRKDVAQWSLARQSPAIVLVGTEYCYLHTENEFVKNEKVANARRWEIVLRSVPLYYAVVVDFGSDGCVTNQTRIITIRK
jgi:hypothetical protein